MHKKLFIFDLDGTLIDSRRDLATAVNLMRRHYGLEPLDVDVIATYVGNGMRMLVSRSLQGLDVNLDEAGKIQKSCYIQHLHDETTLYPGVREGLQALHRAGHLLAVATNKDTDACEQILAYFRLRNLFGSVIGGSSGDALKPHPQMIVRTMKKLHMRPEDTWMIGDHVTDLKAAREAGVNSAFMTYGIGALDGETPTRTFTTFETFALTFLDEPVP